MTNDIQGSFIYKLSVHIVLPGTISDCFVLLIFCHPFYSVDAGPLWDIWTTNMFSMAACCLFIFFEGSLKELMC